MVDVGVEDVVSHRKDTTRLLRVILERLFS